MNYEFHLHKMITEYGDPIQYYFKSDGAKISVNEWVGKQITLRYQNEIKCIECGEITPTSFSGGFCYECFSHSPQNSECIINPELCQGHLGVGRDPEWEERFHNKPHIVYLSFTGGFKVGVTSEHQIPTRWIDQGAINAVVLARTPYRQLAGEIEVFCKGFMADKTNWSKMLKTISTDEDIQLLREEVKGKLPSNLQKYVPFVEEEMLLKYPVDRGFSKFKSLSFDKSNLVKGVLHGVKGQYFIFDDGQAINIRKHAGYLVSVELEENPVLSLF